MVEAYGICECVCVGRVCQPGGESLEASGSRVGSGFGSLFDSFTRRNAHTQRNKVRHISIYLYVYPLNNSATDAAVALCTANPGCKSLSQKYSLTAYSQLGSLVYHVGVPLYIVSLVPVTLSSW